MLDQHGPLKIKKRIRINLNLWIGNFENHLWSNLGLKINMKPGKSHHIF